MMKYCIKYQQKIVCNSSSRLRLAQTSSCGAPLKLAFSATHPAIRTGHIVDLKWSLVGQVSESGPWIRLILRPFAGARAQRLRIFCRHTACEQRSSESRVGCAAHKCLAQAIRQV